MSLGSALKDLLQNITPGYKAPDDEFFVAANETFRLNYKKLGVITNEDEQDKATNSNVVNQVKIDCNVPGCLLTFENVQDYQSHYNALHRYFCSSCRNRTFPTPHLLDLHISETHDSFFQAKVERGSPMYACYLEECKELMLTPGERKEHCIAIHKFPANFRFDKFRGQDKKQQQKMEIDAPENMAAVNTVKAFSFGHNKERSFNKKCTKKPVGATLENLNDLKEALED